MKKISIIVLICIISGILCGCSTKQEEPSKKSCKLDNGSLNYTNFSCPQMKDIKANGSLFFITSSGELYEYSNKKYSTTNNNCRKVESDILFDNIIKNTLISKDGSFYSYYDSQLKQITNDEINKGRAWYGLDQMEIRAYKANNKIFYLDQLGLEDPEIYGYIDNNSVYTITYDYGTNKTNEELLITFKDEEKIEKVINGYVVTNKGYYKYGITNQKECSEYEDIKCKYGPVLVDTIDNCKEVVYISNNLIVTKNMIK